MRAQMPLRRLPVAATLLLTLLFVSTAGAQDEDAGPAAPAVTEGETITFDQVDRLQGVLPPELWPFREFIFYEGMRLEIGPAFRDYSPPPAYQAATEKYRDQASLGPDGSLENYVAGQPFPMDAIDCGGDPDAGTKVIWNFDYRFQGAGQRAHGYYSYWDRGEELPLYYEGTGTNIWLAHRSEPQYLDRERRRPLPRASGESWPTASK